MKTFDLQAYAAKARETVAEGSVLLRNQDNVLPFPKDSRVAVFGRSQFNYYKSGTGSGGLVNTAHVPTITEALEASGRVQVDKELKAVYEAWLQDHPFDMGQGWAAEPWYQEEMPLDMALVEKLSGQNDAALVILGRTAGEDKDNSAAEGSYLLAGAERQVLETVCRAFSKVAVVLNTGSVLDMKWVEEYQPQAVMYVWQGGQEGGLGVADVLTGQAYPSGKLSDTIARDITDYPAANDFGSEIRNIYPEDIYVGYRYFETFAPEKVLYPFGFGLGYTQFEVKTTAISVDSANHIGLEASVKNVGSVPGKEVVQVYYSAPQGKLGKPARALCAFAKTPELTPGEESTLNFTFSVDLLASYDDSGVTGHKSAWVIEPGEYRFFAGADVRSAKPVGSVTLEAQVLEQLEEAMAPVTAFQRLRPGEEADGVYAKTYEPVPLRTVSPAERRAAHPAPEIPQTGDKGWKLADVAEGKVSLDAFVGQLSDEDLCAIVRGEGMCSPKVTPGTAGAFGGVTERLLDTFGIPTGCCADGPSGIRMDCGTMAFAMPNGTCQACTFNTQLVGELYEYEGLELRKNRVDTLLGPGINIHRHPLNGRNFEYFSEDPLLTGRMAASQLNAMHKYGVTGTIKHFACNSQEFHRHDVEAVVSERALREIYLRSFEIAVKAGHARSIMTSYNPVNGFWSASNYDLLTTILHEQWGFAGQVMTDWWARCNDEGQDGDRSNTAAMVRAQNDLYMVVNNAKTHEDNSAQGLQEGTVSRGEFQQCAKNICAFLLESPALLRLRGVETDLDKALGEAPSFDDGSAAQMYYAQTDETGRADIDTSVISLEKGQNTRFSVSVNERGFYTLTMRLRSTDSNDVSQLPISVFQDRNLLGTITLTGAQREWETFTLDVAAFSGTFYLRFFAAQTGLAMESCVLTMKQSLEEQIRKQMG